MTTEEHLNRIVAKCRELLVIAKERTPGKWEWHWRKDDVDFPGSVFSMTRPGHCYAVAMCPRYGFDRFANDADFIASCAGPAEAGWRATIAAIEGLKSAESLIYSVQNDYDDSPPKWWTERRAEVIEAQNQIIASWPEQLLS